MSLDDVWRLFEEEVFSVPSTSGGGFPLFNHYHDADPGADLPGAREIRRANLLNYLRSFSGRPSVVVVGEAPGWRGCRFSGVPFTSEVQLLSGVLPFMGRQSSARASPYAETSATIFWRHMASYRSQFLAWNCIPFHPHRPGDALSNRSPTRREIAAHLGLLSGLLSLLQPRHVVAAGRSAELALEQIGVAALYVRHPSCGGANEFRVGIAEVFRLL